MKSLSGKLAIVLTAFFVSTAAFAGCKITVKASYKTAVNDPYTGKRINAITLDLAKSQVRKKVGWWKKLTSCSPLQPEIGYGGRVSSSCTLTFSCKGNRRYRFKAYYKDSRGTQQSSEYIYYPSSSDWVNHKTNTVVDLRDIGVSFR